MTHDDVDALAGAGGSDEETGLLVGDEQLHEPCVAHRVHRRHDDLVEHSVLRDGRRVLQLFRPLLPAPEALKGENTRLIVLILRMLLYLVPEVLNTGMGLLKAG